MEDHPLTPEERFTEFQRHIGKQCALLDDLDLDSIKAFLERIPSLTERVDFLSFISKLPDGGVVNDIVVDPARHRRNTEAIRRPLDQERTRLLSQHFDLLRIRRAAEQIPNHLEAIAYLRGVLESYIDYHPSIRQGSYSPEELTFVKTIESKIQLRKDLHAASLQPSLMPHSEQEAARANQLYEEVKGIANSGKSLDENTARLIVELADDAIKEFGNTNQEKKVELRKLKAEAEDFLPPATVEEIKKRAEGKALKTIYPKNKVLQKTAYITIFIILIVSSSLAILKVLTPSHNTVPAESTGPYPNSPAVTKQFDVERGISLFDLGFDIYAYGLGRDANLDNASMGGFRQKLENDFRSLDIKPSSVEAGPNLYHETYNQLTSQIEKQCLKLGVDMAAAHSLGLLIVLHPGTDHSKNAGSKLLEAKNNIENSLLELNLIPSTYLTNSDVQTLQPDESMSTNDYSARIEQLRSKVRAALRARYGPNK